MSQSLTALYLQNPQLANALRRQSRGAQMLQQGADSSPVDHPLQGFARLAQALVGGYEQGQADKEIKGEGERQKALAESLMAPIGGPPQMQAPAMPTQPVAPRQPVAQQSMAPPDLDPLIQKASQETGIPAPLLTGLLAQESGFRPDARNPRSTATGIAQVLDSTAANPGYGMTPLSPEARLDPAQAIPWAAQYLARRGQSLGVTDWNNPQQAERGLRAYGENTPEYAQSVMRRAGMGGETTPTQAPGAAPVPRAPDAAAHYTTQAQEYQRRAQAAIAGGRPDLAGILQQQAQMAQQMAMARAPQPKTPIQVVDPNDPSGRRLVWMDPDRAVGMAAPPKEPLVTIDQKGEGTFAQERGRTLAARATGWEDAETKGNERLRSAQQFRAALEGIETGFGTQTQITLGQIAKKLGVPAASVDAMGLDVNSTAKREEIRSLANRMVLGALGAGGFPAQGFSNADRDFLTAMQPGLLNSAEGNRAILALTEEGAKRDIALSRAWRDWRKTNGESPESVRRFEDEKMPGLIAPDGTVQRILEDSGWKDTTAADNIPTITDPAEAQRLPPGTQFRTPDGRTLRVPGR